MCTVGTIRVRVGACRKESTGDYGSVGGSAEIEVELHGATDGDIERERRKWLSLALAVVDDAIREQRGEAPRPAAPAPSPDAAPPRKETGRWGTADDGRAARRTPPGRKAGEARGDDDPPNTGRALFARLKDLDEANGSDLVKHVSKWGKARGVEGRITEWGRDEVKAGWAEARRYAEALRESESLQGSY